MRWPHHSWRETVHGWIFSSQLNQVFFHVSGTTAHPRIETVPAPILSDAGAALFGRMINPPKNQRLLDAVREKKK